MAVATSDSMEVTTNRDVTNEQLAADLAVTDTPSADAAAEPIATPPAATAKPHEPPAEAPTAEDEPEPDPASDAGKKLAGRKRTLQQRIDQVTWEKHQEAAKREALEKELTALKAPKTEPATQTDGRPRLKTYIDQIGTTYDTYEDAVDAHADALSDYKLAARDQASNAAQQAHAYQSALHTVRTRGTETHADFDAVLGQFVQQGGTFAPRTPAEANGPLADLEQTILHHPLGHVIAYALAKDAETYQRVVAAPSRVMFMAEMGKLITRVEGVPSGSPAKPAPLSKAKPPIQPLGSSPVASDQDPDDLPFGPQYVRTMNKKFGK